RMMCGVSAARAIASPRVASRASPEPSASHIPAWVACSAGRVSGRISDPYPTRNVSGTPELTVERVDQQFFDARDEFGTSPAEDSARALGQMFDGVAVIPEDVVIEVRAPRRQFLGRQVP